DREAAEDDVEQQHRQEQAHRPAEPPRVRRHAGAGGGGVGHGELSGPALRGGRGGIIVTAAAVFRRTAGGGVPMSDRFVVVASCALAPEAQLAVNLLESAGIEAMLDGEIVGGVFAGMSALGDQLRVRVRAGDAARAASLLAEAQARAQLPGDWEDGAETTVV